MIAWGSLLLLICTLVITSNWQNKKFRQRLLSSPAFASARVLQLKKEGKNPLAATYIFGTSPYDSFASSRGDARYEKLGRELFDHSFPVIYNNHDPQISAILIFPDNFEELGLPYPDSLQWVKEMLDR